MFSLMLPDRRRVRRSHDRIASAVRDQVRQTAKRESSNCVDDVRGERHRELRGGSDSFESSQHLPGTIIKAWAERHELVFCLACCRKGAGRRARSPRLCVWKASQGRAVFFSREQTQKKNGKRI